MKKLPVLTLMFCLGTGPAFAAAPMELMYQSFWSASHQLNKDIIEPWCQGFEKATNGEVILHYNPNTALVPQPSAASAIRSGNLDAGGIQLQTAVSMMPLSQLLAMPFMVQNAQEACILANKMYETFPEIRAEIDKNFKFMTAVGSDVYAFIATGGLIRTPADLVGKRVLVWAPYQIEEVKAWGGIPVQTVSTETYLGLQRGLAEVAYIPAPTIDGGKLVEVAKFITLFPARSLPMIMAFNHDAYKRLPDSAKRYIAETTGAAMSERLGAALVRLTDGDNVKHVEKGATLHFMTLEEQQLFRDASAQVNRAYWLNELSSNNVPNPEQWIQRVEQLAKETFMR